MTAQTEITASLQSEVKICREYYTQGHKDTDKILLISSSPAPAV